MKVVPRVSAREAANLVPNDAVVMVGGFGMTGCPVHTLHALAERDVDRPTVITNNLGQPGP